MAQAVVHTITEEDLLRYGAEGQPVEVVNGEIVMMTGAGIRHSLLAANAYRVLFEYASRTGSGYAFTDGMICILERGADGSVLKSRIPDAAYISKDRIPVDFDLSRPFQGAPNVAVEVVSPTETTTDTANKIRDYLDSGTDQVWVVYPDQQEVHQHQRGSDTIRVYRGEMALDVTAVLPGLTTTAAELLALPPMAAT